MSGWLSGVVGGLLWVGALVSIAGCGGADEVDATVASETEAFQQAFGEYAALWRVVQRAGRPEFVAQDASVGRSVIVAVRSRPEHPPVRLARAHAGLPADLRAKDSNEVETVVFVESEERTVGTYGGTTPAVAAVLRVTVFDRRLSRVVAVRELIGMPPEEKSTWVAAAEGRVLGEWPTIGEIISFLRSIRTP